MYITLQLPWNSGELLSVLASMSANLVSTSAQLDAVLMFTFYKIQSCFLYVSFVIFK